MSDWDFLTESWTQNQFENDGVYHPNDQQYHFNDRELMRRLNRLEDAVMSNKSHAGGASNEVKNYNQEINHNLSDQTLSRIDEFYGLLRYLQELKEQQVYQSRIDKVKQELQQLKESIESRIRRELS